MFLDLAHIVKVRNLWYDKAVFFIRSYYIKEVFT